MSLELELNLKTFFKACNVKTSVDLSILIGYHLVCLIVLKVKATLRPDFINLCFIPYFFYFDFFKFCYVKIKIPKAVAPCG